MNIGLIKITMCLFISFAISTSCNKEKNINIKEIIKEKFIVKEQNKKIVLSEKASLSILSSDEVKDLIEIQNLFIDKIKQAVAKGYSVQELSRLSINAINYNQHTEILKVIFGSVNEGNIFIQNVQNAKLKFISKYKFILENREDFECNSCTQLTAQSVNLFYINLNIYDKSRLKVPSVDLPISTISLNDELLEGDKPVCGSYWQQVKLLACMSLCSVSTGGLGTVLCGWGCWCMTCPESVTGGIIC
jgi:hypothetical protein